MYCKKCGADLKREAKFCPKCGTKQKKQIHKRTIIGIVCAIAAAVIIPASLAASGQSVVPRNSLPQETFLEQETMNEAQANETDFPTEVKNELPVQSNTHHQIAVGQMHSVAVVAEGSVVAAGWNEDDQCDISGWSDVISVSASEVGTAALRRDGTIYVAGELAGNEAETWSGIQYMEVSGEGDYVVGLKNDGTVCVTESEYITQSDVSGWDNIEMIATAWYACLFGVKSDGSVLAAGNNDYGQCDVVDWTDIVSVSAGSKHVIGLRDDGTVVATGDNDSMQCEVGDWADIVQVAAFGNNTYGLTGRGTVVASGDNSYGQCTVDEWIDIEKIIAGTNTIFGIKKDGTVAAAGDNSYGQCDMGEWVDIVDIASLFHTIGLRSDGSIVAIGYNEYGQCDISMDVSVEVTQKDVGGDASENLPDVHVYSVYKKEFERSCKFAPTIDYLDHTVHISFIDVPGINSEARGAMELNEIIKNQYGPLIDQLETETENTRYWFDVNYDVSYEGDTIIITVRNRDSYCLSEYHDYKDVYIYNVSSDEYEAQIDQPEDLLS